MKSLFSVMAIALALFAPVTVWSEGPVVAIDSGQIQGVALEDGMAVFRGIPYAAAPVGELRWKEPQPAAAWDGVRDCTAFGAVAPQTNRLAQMTGEELPATSEDCLFLNVWSGNVGGAEKLPVMVWIHGGGWTAGYGHQGLYDGVHFAKDGVVYVSINYRMGPFGFFAHALLTEESPNGSSGNYGLLDQVAALEWVQRNIAAFGGDASNVTIFGESAGGSSVYALCASPLASGLFHRAISESAWVVPNNFVPLHDSGPGVDSCEAVGTRLAEAWLGANVPVTLDSLRAMPANELFARVGERYEPACAIDGWFMPDFPERIFDSGRQNDVSLIAGTNRDEGTMFAMMFTYKDQAEYEAAAAALYGAHAQELLAIYPGADAGQMRESITQQITDSWFVRPARALVRGYENVSSNAYLYHFSQIGHQLPFLKAHHAAEIAYAFGNMDGTKAAERDYAISKEMHAYWVQFAKVGDPNTEGLPVWPAYSTRADAHLEFGASGTAAAAGLRAEACDLLDEVYADYLARASAPAVSNTD